MGPPSFNFFSYIYIDNKIFSFVIYTITVQDCGNKYFEIETITNTKLQISSKLKCLPLQVKPFPE